MINVFLSKSRFMQLLPFVLFFCLFLFSSSAVNAQQWTIHGDDAFTALAKVDDSTFVAITSSGQVLRTTDGWDTWSHTDIESEYTMRWLAFSGQHGLIIGDRCYYYSPDGGKSWTRTRYPSWEAYSYLVALNEGAFYFLDSRGRIYSSVKGEEPTIVNDSLVWSYLSTTMDGYLVGQAADGRREKLFESSDGGVTWSVMATSLDPEKTVYQYAFTDRAHMTVLIATSGRNYGLYSSDGGMSWDTLASEGPLWTLDSTTFRIGDLIYSTLTGLVDSVHLNSYQFNAPEIMVGDVIYRLNAEEIKSSTDLTRTWDKMLRISYSNNYLLRSYAPGKLKYHGSFNGLEGIFHSTDDGFSWRPQGRMKWDPLVNIVDNEWITDSIGYLNLSDSIVYTKDAGRSYTTILRRSETGASLGFMYKRGISPSDSVVFLLSDGKLYSIAAEAVTESPLPIKSLNGADIRGSNMALTGFDDTKSPVLCVSRDGGKNWVVNPFTEAGQVAIVDHSTIFKRGSSNWQRTTDDGKTWTVLSHPGSQGDYYFHSSDSLIVSNDSIRVSTNGGKTWRAKITYPYFIDGQISEAFDKVYFRSNHRLASISLHDLFGAQPVIPSVAKIQWWFGSGSDFSVAEAPNGELVKWSETAAYKIMRSSDLGKTWVRSDSNAPKDYTHRLLTAGNEMFTSYGFRSTTQGRTWNRIGLWAATISAAAYAKNGYLFIASSSNGLNFSRDKGKSWNLKDTVLRNVMTHELLAHPITGDLYAATEIGVLRSVDNGVNWDTLRSRRHTGLFPTRLTITPSGKLYYATENRIEASTDDGASWYGLPPLGYSIALVAVHDSLLCGLFGNNDNYFYYTTDDGQYWTQCDTFKSGPNRLENLTDLRLLKIGHLVVAGETHGVSRTVFPVGETKSVVSETDPIEQKAVPCLTLSPNPACSSITVAGDCVRPGSAVIYNSSGAKCWETRWWNNDPIDVTSLAPGVYYLQLGAERSRFVITR
jgi:photosystem II stability/assembly factor-like uncharacterized protein